MTFNYTPPPDHGLDILYQDAHLVALVKPEGLLSVPGRGPERADSLASRVQKRLPSARVVHRLDMATSGIMIMALDAETHRMLNRLFQERRVNKRYTAMVANRVALPAGDIDLPLITDWPSRPRQKVDPTHGKPALTHYRVLQHDERSSVTRLQLTPVTGRSHQLRVHMQAIGHPILGDRLYATEQVQHMSSRLLLHATELAFEHPITLEPIQLYSPVPF